MHVSFKSKIESWHPQKWTN